MKVLITGKNGQLGSELLKTIPEGVECIAFGRELDISNEQLVYETLQEHRPSLIINAAAYTAVDKAESERELAFAVNGKGPAYLARGCKTIGARLIHISTDFVFDGSKTSPYGASDKTAPLNVYGESKLAGEKAIAEVLGSDAVIVRTAWVYSVYGNNFVKTMLRLMKEKSQLGVVYDQVGTPTWAHGLAALVWSLVNKNWMGNSDTTTAILNWTDAGVASWYDFAEAIQTLALNLGLIEKAIPIRPIPAAAYPTPAKRPAFSVLDKYAAESMSGLETIHWRKQLASMLQQLVLINNK